MTGAPLQGAIGKSTGGSSQIQHPFSGKIDLKGFQRLDQFQSAAADIGIGMAGKRQFSGLLDHGASLVDPLPVHRNLAGQNIGFRLIPACRQAFLNDQRVKPMGWHENPLR